MRVFTVHIRRHALDPDKDVRLVKEGFSWPAFLFSFLWALWNRMWWTALGLFVIVSGVGLTVEFFFPGSPAGTAVLLALYLAIGWMGNDMIRRNLESQGFEDKGPVRAQDEDEALYRYLDADPVLARDLAGAGFRAG
jgi:hypothetical protein